MKKFRFSLESVLKYKNQLLDGLKAEHGALLSAVRKQEEEIQTLEQQCAQVNRELNDKNKAGITPLEMIQYKQYIQKLQYQIREQYYRLEDMKKEEEAKKSEVIEMKKETASFDIIKEKRLTEYRVQMQKAEEAHIDELISNKLYRNSRD